jgi:hypothetical protein
MERYEKSKRNIQILAILLIVISILQSGYSLYQSGFINNNFSKVYNDLTYYLVMLGLGILINKLIKKDINISEIMTLILSIISTRISFISKGNLAYFW